VDDLQTTRGPSRHKSHVVMHLGVLTGISGTIAVGACWRQSWAGAAAASACVLCGVLWIVGTLRTRVVLSGSKICIFNLIGRTCLDIDSLLALRVDRYFRVFAIRKHGAGHVRVECMRPRANPRMPLCRKEGEAILDETWRLAEALHVDVVNETGWGQPPNHGEPVSTPN